MPGSSTQHQMTLRSGEGALAALRSMPVVTQPQCSHLLQQSILPAWLICRMTEFAQGVVHERLVTGARDMCISGPMMNAPRAEVLLNTKIAVQYSWENLKRQCLPVAERKCARCRGSHEEDLDSMRKCCGSERQGCGDCIGQRYVCPQEGCGVEYVRRWTYETGSGRGSIGRNRAQVKVLPFTRDMHIMASEWSKQSDQEYNNVVLVTYCGASMCAHCLCVQSAPWEHKVREHAWNAPRQCTRKVTLEFSGAMLT